MVFERLQMIGKRQIVYRIYKRQPFRETVDHAAANRQAGFVQIGQHAGRDLGICLVPDRTVRITGYLEAKTGAAARLNRAAIVFRF